MRNLIVFCLIPFASIGNAAVVGSLDLINQRSAFGWACDQSNPTAHSEVQIWARSISTGSYTLLESSTANKERLDVGASKCMW